MNLQDPFINNTPDGEPDEESALVAMPIFCNGKRYDLGAVVEHLKSFWKLEVTEAEGGEDVAVFEVDGQLTAIAHMPTGFPKEAQQEMIQTAVFWQAVADDMKGHDSHAIVTIFHGDSGPVGQFLLMTKILYSIFATSEAVGVFIGSQSLMLGREMYMDCTEMSIQDSEAPVLLWVFFGPAADEQGNSLYTFGMNAFGKHDMEIVHSRLEMGDLLDIMISFVGYVVSNDVTLQPGETIGFSEDQKIPITLSEGVFVEGETLKLEM